MNSGRLDPQSRICSQSAVSYCFNPTVHSSLVSVTLYTEAILAKCSLVSPCLLPSDISCTLGALTVGSQREVPDTFQAVRHRAHDLRILHHPSIQRPGARLADTGVVPSRLSLHSNLHRVQCAVHFRPGKVGRSLVFSLAQDEKAQGRLGVLTSSQGNYWAMMRS